MTLNFSCRVNDLDLDLSGILLQVPGVKLWRSRLGWLGRTVREQSLTVMYWGVFIIWWLCGGGARFEVMTFVNLCAVILSERIIILKI